MSLPSLARPGLLVLEYLYSPNAVTGSRDLGKFRYKIQHFVQDRPRRAWRTRTAGHVLADVRTGKALRRARPNSRAHLGQRRRCWFRAARHRAAASNEGGCLYLCQPSRGRHGALAVGRRRALLPPSPQRWQDRATTSGIRRISGFIWYCLIIYREIRIHAEFAKRFSHRALESASPIISHPLLDVWNAFGVSWSGDVFVRRSFSLSAILAGPERHPF